jgi:hypothetical protein
MQIIQFPTWVPVVKPAINSSFKVNRTTQYIVLLKEDANTFLRRFVCNACGTSRKNYYLTNKNYQKIYHSLY